MARAGAAPFVRSTEGSEHELASEGVPFEHDDWAAEHHRTDDGLDLGAGGRRDSTGPGVLAMSDPRDDRFDGVTVDRPPG